MVSKGFERTLEGWKGAKGARGARMASVPLASLFCPVSNRNSEKELLNKYDSGREKSEEDRSEEGNLKKDNSE